VGALRKLARAFRLGRLSLIALAVALALVVGGYVVARQQVRGREQQLLQDQAAQTAAVMGSFARQIEAILNAGSVVAEVTGADPGVFERTMSERLESTAITSITLVALEPGGPVTVATAGAPSLLAESFDDDAKQRLSEVAGSNRIDVVEIAETASGRVVGFATSGGDPAHVVYAESVVPALQSVFVLRLAGGSDFALYLGSVQTPELVLASSTDELPLRGATASETVKLGSADGLVVVGARGGLVGGLTAAAPWITVAVGALLAVVVALALEFRRRRRVSEAATRALAEQNERLREVDRLKDELVAVVSHELRTPLTSVLGYVELLGDEADELTEEHRGFLGVIERSARRLLNLVGDLLFVARIDAGGLQLELEQVDVDAVVRECLEAQQPRAVSAGVELALLAEPVTPIAGDAARLGQLLDNLVSNAIKFSPKGGRVEVRLGRAGDALSIEVADTGMGIPVEEQGRVFERFFRSAQATAGAVQGTGLGLTIAKAIVDAHGGTIGVASEEGVGTTFRVELPLEAPPGRLAEQPSVLTG
jgi:signal transduction histidine kinase